MPTNIEALATGRRFQEAGDFPRAEQAYRRVLDANPDLAEGWFFLGCVCQARQRLDEANAHYRRALRLKPDLADAHNNLGILLVLQGNLPDALASIRRALNTHPDFADAHINAGFVLKEMGDHDAALASFHRAIGLNPDNPLAQINLGKLLQKMGRLAGAEECFRKTMRLQPDLAEAHYLLGLVLGGQGRLTEAAASFQETTRLQPNLALAHNNLGVVLAELGELDRAMASYQDAIRLQPDFALAHNNLGIVLADRGEPERAAGCFQEAIRLQPEFVLACINLGNAYRDQAKMDQAEASYRQALRVRPNYAEAENNLGNILKDQGRLDESAQAYRRALTLRPDFALAHCNLASLHHYVPDATLASLGRVHAGWEECHAAPLKSEWRPFPHTRDPDRRLRLGFVSPDLGYNPVGFFLIQCLEALDRDQCETVIYSDRARKDDLTVRFMAAAGTWREVRGLPNEALTEQIQADRIDILVDLAGHFAGNRLLVFARKPAPIQMTWVGYAGSTGLSAIDYLIADRFHIPEGLERSYPENILRLPNGYVCYDPPAYASAVGPLPALARGWATFGSFNYPAKVTPEVVAVWAEILRRVPNSRLVLKYLGFGDDGTRNRYESLFAAHGIDPSRLELEGKSPHVELMNRYNKIDMALDSFPYSGGLTTCEALWMGVPVITCPGETFSSRHSLSHLSNVGLTETIARDLPEYVDLAVGLAHDLPRLAALRAGLRDQMARSPLCDGPGFAGTVLQAFRSAWREWCSAG